MLTKRTICKKTHYICQIFKKNHPMKSYISVFFFVFISTFIGCQNDETISCNINNPTVEISPTTFVGNNIYLKTPVYYINNVIYEWSGPNNFYSNEQNPIILNATTAMSGEYKLTIKKGICATDEIKSTINVITNPATCNQASDTSFISNGFGNSYLYYNTTYVDQNNYIARGGGTDLNVNVTFFGTNQPTTGIYSIIKKSDVLSVGKVKVDNVLFGSTTYNALSGSLVVNYDTGGNIIIKYCSIPFALGNNTTSNHTANALFTKNQ